MRSVFTISHWPAVTTIFDIRRRRGARRVASRESSVTGEVGAVAASARRVHSEYGPGRGKRQTTS